MNNINHFIHMMYNETINNNKWKEVILLSNKIMYWKKETHILNLKYEEGSFEIPWYTLISTTSNWDIKVFLSAYIQNEIKKIKWNKIYCFYNNALYFLECEKDETWQLYNLSNEWYSNYYIL